MKRINFSSLLLKIVITLEIILLIYFLAWHLKLGLVRYFDTDEYVHLHWGYSLLVGQRPYTDFFYLFPPFFLYPIAFIMSIFGRSLASITMARVFIFIVFLASTGVVFLLGRKLKNSHVGLLSALIFAFLPIPFDKTIEVRPDLLATLFALSGLYLFILGQEGNQKSRVYYLASGLCFGLSLGFVPKTAFFLIPPVLVLGYWLFKEVTRLKNSFSNIIFFLSGLFLPALVLLFLLFSYGKPLFALYSMTKMASDVTATLGKKFYMRPDIFFYPNDTYYGVAGISLSLISTIIIYVGGSIWGIHRFLSALLYNHHSRNHSQVQVDKHQGLAGFFIATTFILNLFAFVKIFPLKHAQYLMVFAPFVSIFFADFLYQVGFSDRKEIKKSNLFKNGIRLFGAVLAVFLFTLAGYRMNQEKIKWTNKDTISKINYFLTTIPKDSRVFDLTGETVFFEDGYYFCCLPYGQYQEALNFKLPNLKEELDRRNTNYIHTGGEDRLDILPPMQAKYIRENFVETEVGLMVRRKLR